MKTTVDSRADDHLIALVGRFDAHELPEFHGIVAPLLTSERPNLTVDLSQVIFIDSSALAELVSLDKSAHAVGGRLLLGQLSTPVRVILEITGLLGVFGVGSDSDNDGV
jgi:anti-sigma B factor antagonist